ncbi:PDZ domain-containing protein [Ammoniphilus sp. CFH 90114]|uniref:PDZ domain-containing protein n=1 Tax=Ammoniphilus sp. CFH 90114 TaxID=2493665 RepID=UPI00100F0F12|nr:PDZ domain-containing protein [Ammoniphilus sp. CFH 90114]RXT04017.1 PDZ domain-containing protein [Ammoniphilus sp. CFH 90114]
MAGFVTVLPSFFLNPLLYLFLLLFWRHYYRQIQFERKLYHVRYNNPWEQWFHSVVHGLFGGILASGLLFVLGVAVRPWDFWIIGGLSLVLALFQLQYLCFAYAAGWYALAAFLVQLWPQGKDLTWMSGGWEFMGEVHLPSILGVAAILHIAEAFLVKLNRGRGGSPLFIRGKRGRLLGAYQMQKFWLLPLLVIVPATSNVSMSAPSWWPMLLSVAGTSFALMLFPAAIGFAEVAISQLPKQKARASSRRLLLYSLILLGFAWSTHYFLWAGLMGAIFAIVGHEGMIRFGNWREGKGHPIFTQLGQGIVVLAVLPATPAEKMGIVAGDIILKVNGSDVREADDFYPALQLNSAFCKMEVRNVEGHIKYLQRAVYQGEHHQLGLVLAPDDHTPFYVDMKPVSLVHLIRQQIDKGA